MRIKVICKDIYLGVRRLLLMPLAAVAKPPQSAAGVKKILAIRIDRIGDLIVTMPALKELKKIFPNAKISLLTTGKNAELLNIFPWIDEVIVYKGFFATAGILRKRGFDLAADFLMDYPIKAALLTYFSGAKFTAGFNVAGRGSCFNLGVYQASDKKHVGLYMLDLVRSIAGAYALKDQIGRDLDAGASIRENDRIYATSLLKENGVSENDIVIIMHPGGHYASQLWPADRFARLADMLIEKYGAKIIIVGSPDERRLIDGLSGMMEKKVADITGLSLDKLAALISLADLFIGNNSGPWHIACALGIPTVSTMGPTDPELWWPVDRRHIVVRRSLACSPCDLPECDRHACMKAITVEEMMEAVRIQLANIEKIKR